MATQISRPTVGGTTIPFPSAAVITPFWLYGEVTTIGGKTRRDVMARKYKYTMTWEHMSVSDYNALETVINTLAAFTFVYDKWPQSKSPGVSCLGTLSARTLVYGTGDTDFLSSVTLELTEVDSRI